MAIKDYKNTAVGNNQPDGLFPENMQAKALNDSMRQLQADIANYVVDTFVEITDTVTKITDSSFRLSNVDRTDDFVKGRVVKVNNKYATIVSSVINASNTDVTIDLPIVQASNRISLGLVPDLIPQSINPLVENAPILADKLYAYKDEYKYLY